MVTTVLKIWDLKKIGTNQYANVVIPKFGTNNTYFKIKY
jgi:hypothetical protein